jgi:hypothetical protein
MYKFAGIHHVDRIGKYGVQEASNLLKKLSYAYYRLMKIEAAHVPARMNWHFKAGLARQLYEDCMAMKLLMKRGSELRMPQAQRMKSPDPWLEVLFDELLMARSDYELWVGLYEVVKPEMHKILSDYIVSTQQLVDYPGRRVARQALLDLEDQLAWAAAIKPVLLEDAAFFLNSDDQYDIVADDDTSAAPYRDQLTGYLLGNGGFSGKPVQTASASAPHRSRSNEAFKQPSRAVRDPRMGPDTLGRTGVGNPAKDPVIAKAIESARVRQEEMGAAELCAAVLAWQPDMPWEFYEDIARHCWDEMRHTLFGQAVMDSAGYEWYTQPQFKGDYDPHTNKTLASSYVWLSIAVEGDAMHKDSMPAESKRLYELSAKSDDPAIHLLAQCIDFDWADEVTHHQYGRRWSAELLGDELTAKRIADRENKLNNVRSAKDTIEYWKDKENNLIGEMYTSYFQQFLTPELLKEIETNG